MNLGVVKFNGVLVMFGDRSLGTMGVELPGKKLRHSGNFYGWS